MGSISTTVLSSQKQYIITEDNIQQNYLLRQIYINNAENQIKTLYSNTFNAILNPCQNSSEYAKKVQYFESILDEKDFLIDYAQNIIQLELYFQNSKSKHSLQVSNNLSMDDKSSDANKEPLQQNDQKIFKFLYGELKPFKPSGDEQKKLEDHSKEFIQANQKKQGDSLYDRKKQEKDFFNWILFQYNAAHIKKWIYFKHLFRQYLIIPLKMVLSSIILFAAILVYPIRYLISCFSSSEENKQLSQFKLSNDSTSSFFSYFWNSQTERKRKRTFNNLNQNVQCSPVTVTDYLKFFFFSGLICVYVLLDQKDPERDTSNSHVKIMIMFAIGKQMLLFLLEILSKVTNINVTFEENIQGKIEVIERQEISDQDLYIEFARDPLELELVLQIKYYYMDEIIEKQHKEQRDNKYKNRVWFGGLNLFYQYLFTSSKYPLSSSTPGIDDEYLKRYEQRMSYKVNKGYQIFLAKIRRVCGYIIKIVFFLVLVVNFFFVFFVYDEKSLYNFKYSGTFQNIFKNFSNLIFILLFDFPSKTLEELKAYRYSIFRLTAMITFDRSESALKNDPSFKQDLPCINLFCITSIKTWYSLRKLTFQQNIIKKNITSLHVILEFFIAVSLFFMYWPTFYSIIMMYDNCKEGETSHQNFLILGVLLYKIIIDSLFVTIYEFSQVNSAYFTHLDILKETLHKLNKIKVQYKKLSKKFDELLDDTVKLDNLKNNEVSQKVYWQFEGVKEIKRLTYFFNQEHQGDKFSEPVDQSERENQQISYLDKLIDCYSLIINDLSENQYENQLQFLGIFPLNYEHVQNLLSLAVPIIGRSILKLFKSADFGMVKYLVDGVWEYLK